MSTVSPGTAAYGGFPTASEAGATRNTLQAGIAGTVTTPVAGVTTTTRASRGWRSSRLAQHRLNRGLTLSPTVAVVNASVTVATDAINAVRIADRRPATLINGKRTGRIRRLEQGAVATLSTLVGGTLYTAGTYTNVPMVRVGAAGDLLAYGGGLACDITVSGGGIVTACTLVAARNGRGYAPDTIVTAAPGTIGPGSAFSITVDTVEQA